MEKISNMTKVDANAFDKILEAKKNDPSFIKIVKEFKLTENEIKSNISKIDDCIEELSHCKKCKNLNSCQNHVKGYVYYPEKKESRIVFNYVACKHLKQYEENMQNKKGQNELEKARIKDIDITDKNRFTLIKWLNNFYHNYDASKANKGLYLHGTFGSGKTYLIAALLNELKINKNAEYEIVYLPELLRTLKENFYSLDSKIRYYSEIEILFIDDIGAEKVTEWGRDEILATILQSRMNNHMTTFFTSNLNLEALEKHLSITKDNEDIVKARRLLERITKLADEMELISTNRRN